MGVHAAADLSVAFDLREEIALAEGAVTVAGVSWSATLWGAVDETFTTVGWTNLTTGAAGAMATDMFIPGEPTNLTANAYTAVGYAFRGWTTNGVDKLYDDRAAGVDFARPGETLALRARWDDTGVTVTTFAQLTNVLVTATNQTAALPVRVILPADVVFPADGCMTVYAGGNRPAIAFEGAGLFDVSGVAPKWGEPVVEGAVVRVV